jgi:two-component system phosphate regulon sensor histidine kinase PhoR
VSIAVIVLAAIAVVLVVRVAYHQLHLTALRGWLRRPQLETLPRGRGVWEEALAELHRFLKRRDAEQESLGQSLARFRAAVRAPSRRRGDPGPGAPHRMGQPDRRAPLRHRRPARSGPAGGQPHPPAGLRDLLGAGDFSQPLALRARDTTLSVRVIEFGEEQKLLNSRDVTADERIDTMRRDFVANVSHELKTPVTVLSGFVETLSDESFPMSPAQRGRYLAMMAEQAKAHAAPGGGSAHAVGAGVQRSARGGAADRAASLRRAPRG